MSEDLEWRYIVSYGPGPLIVNMHYIYGANVYSIRN